jgi:DNA-binding transcriptional LysR family regulator
MSPITERSAVSLKRLEYFAVLAAESSFRLAAARLGISQPSLSQQISKLEDDLGITLLDRSTHPIATTPAGGQILARARVLLEEAGRIWEIARNAADGGTGTLRVGCAPSLQYSGIPRLVGRFKSAQPSIATELTTRPTNNLIEMLRLDQVDVAFLFRAPDDALLEAVELSRQPYHVILPVEHSLAEKKVIGLQELRDEPIIIPVRRSTPTFYDQMVAALLASDFTSLHDVAEGATLLDQMSDVSAGRGLTLVPCGVAESVTLPGTISRPLADRGLYVPVVMSWKRHDQSDTAIDAFRDFASSQAGELVSGGYTR